MKALLSVLLLTSIPITGFTQSAFTTKNKLPKCNSALIRMSKQKIKCEGDLPLKLDFDIPALQINLDELEQILQGAESSGGHTINDNTAVGRMSFQKVPIINLNRNFNCHIKFLADGGKKVSWLSSTSVELKSPNYNGVKHYSQWKHGVILGNNINSKTIFLVKKGPKENLGQINLRVKHGNKPGTFTLSLCQENLVNDSNRMVSSCTSTLLDMDQSVWAMDLEFTEVSKSGNGFRAIKKIQAICY